MDIFKSIFTWRLVYQVLAFCVPVSLYVGTSLTRGCIFSKLFWSMPQTLLVLLACFACIWRRVLVETEATAVTLPGWMAYQRRL